MLTVDDFAVFFEEVNGCAPFPWQKRLLYQVAEKGEWLSMLDLPTGSGKTAAIDIAVFHLALEADRGAARRAPVRIAFVVDRRLIVDDAFARAERLAKALCAPQGPMTQRVAERLMVLSGGGPALIARRLRGGIPREDDWARTPSQPTVLCSTVDQVGSRLLFRGYGVSDSMKPVHAGLIGSDCLILLDEAHLAEPFRQTLDWVRTYKGRNWRETDEAAPWGVALLSATPGEASKDAFSLSEEDRSHPVLRRRLEASKPARLVTAAAPKAAEERADPADEQAITGKRDRAHRAELVIEQVERALAHFKAARSGAQNPAIGVVLNRVARARAAFDRLKVAIGEDRADFLLLIGPARPVDRDELADRLAPIRTGAERHLQKPLILVATQCIEAGVDIDLDALVSEAAPLDALRQRFGRLNRDGRNIIPYAAIIATKTDLSKRFEDPVYGRSIKAAWDCLMEAKKSEGRDDLVDFGLQAFAVRLEKEALSPRDDAPVLLPAHVDLLSQTSPIPAADPEIALYLHGAGREPDSIMVVWRADIDPEKHDAADIRRLLLLVPPRSREAIELPLWAVRQWLQGNGRSSDRLADAATGAPAEEERSRSETMNRRVFRWRGDDARSRWIKPSELRPGDTIVVPAVYGGVDAFGWNPDPEYREAAQDVWQKAAEPFAGRRFAVRVASGLLGESVSEELLSDALASAASSDWRGLRATLLELDLPRELRDDLAALDYAKAGRVVAYTDLYGTDAIGRPRGAVFVAPFGIVERDQEEEGLPNATEDDASGSIVGFSLTLAEHSQDVEAKAAAFARAAGLPEPRVEDLKLAGYLHDAGKADSRFQRWLHYGDPLGPDLDDPSAVLAKSGRPLARETRAASGLPENWRHEALSVRLAPHIVRFTEARDPDLVLWLVGTHHGHGRPFFPHRDEEDLRPRRLPAVLGIPAELPPGSGPQSLAFDWNGADWCALFDRLKARYGAWELARMEAILRLADHRASEERAQ